MNSSPLPTSVIIVGVGNEEFELMVELDSDDTLLTDDNGRKCTRDIVQFVKFNECMQRGNLAEEVLKEVPDQVCLYMEQNQIKPVIPHTSIGDINLIQSSRGDASGRGDASTSL